MARVEAVLASGGCASRAAEPAVAAPAVPAARARGPGAPAGPPAVEAWTASARRRGRFQQRLLSWYRHHRRHVPWRDSADPYRVWISEVMLQQTRVEQMGPYFARFLARFATLAELAAASEDEVLKAWEGLGYYARARNLLRAARCVVREHGGRLPEDRAALARLPGIGRYTSAAIASIAFGQDHAVLDGNVTRVLCRLLQIGDDPRRGAARARLRQSAELLLPRGRAAEYNQAMMELGARVCTPARPACSACPVRAYCGARQRPGDPAELPARPARPARPHVQVAAGVVWRGDALLIAQRPAEAMLGGMWEFPGGKQEPGESLPECLARELREELGIRVAVLDHLASIEHAYTHLSITLHAFRAVWLGGRPRALGCADWRWVRWSELGEFAMARADRKLIARLGDEPAVGPDRAAAAARRGRAGAARSRRT